MQFSAVLFDLDGTLLDTLDDLADSMNAVLALQNFPVHPKDAYRFFVGDGMDVLVRRVLPEEHRDEHTVMRSIELMRGEYRKHMFDKTRPYDGILSLLDGLSIKRVPMAVLSNKPDENTKFMVNRYFGPDMFAVVAGQRPEAGRKPDPAGALAIARQFNIPPQSILYLGDTGTDMKTAVAAGMFPVGALWGFRSEEELLQYGAKEVAVRPEAVLSFFNE